MDSNEQNYVWGRVFLFHPTGARIELPIPAEPKDAFAYVSECLAAGFLTSAPDNTGLDKIDVAYVIRGQKTDDKGTVDRLYFYAEWAQQSSNMTVYLDTPEQVAKFERVSGLKVASMPLYEGDTAPQRNGNGFAKFMRPVNFTITRRKVESKNSPVGYRWELVDYTTGTPVQQSTPPMQNVATTANAFPDKASARLFIKSWEHEHVDSDAILTALGVKAYGAYQGTLAEANALVKQFVADRALSF